MKILLSLLFPGLALFIFWLLYYFEEDNIKLRKINKKREKWYKKYPVGTNIEIITWEKKTPKTQMEANNQLDWRMICAEKATAMYFRDDYGDLRTYKSSIVKKAELEKVFKYYTVVSLQEYYKAQHIEGTKYRLKWHANENGVLLYCKNDKNEFYSISTETELEFKKGLKEIHKVSDVKMKILELKGRESKNEIAKSYSNSRKKNYRKDIQSK